MIENKHLSEEQIAICADAINESSYSSLDSALRDHLAICDDCAAEVLMVADIAYDFKETKKKGKVINFKRWYLATASIAAAGIVLLLVFNLFKPQDHDTLTAEFYSEEMEVDSTEADTTISSSHEIRSEFIVEKPQVINQDIETTTAEKVEEKKLPTPYSPDENLEKLFNNYTQAYRGERVVVSTTGVINYAQTDTLRWSNPNKQMLIIEFFNNRGEKIITLQNKSTGTPFPDFEPGLYYWKLINNDFDLLFVGKIMVE